MEHRGRRVSASVLCSSLIVFRLPSRMIVCVCGELYYSAWLAWISVAIILAAAPAGCYVWHFVNLPPEWIPVAWSALDHLCAATLLSSLLYWFNLCNLTSEYYACAKRPELLALRVISSLVASGAAISLVTLLPRPVLTASAALYIALSLNLSSWWSALWLELQDGGLGSLLPPPLVHLLVHERPLDWLRRNMFGAVLLRCRQLAPLLVLPEQDLHHGLSLLPPDLRQALERRGLGHLLLPASVRRVLLEPWASGPQYLRVRPLRLSSAPLELFNITRETSGGAIAASASNGSCHHHRSCLNSGGEAELDECEQGAPQQAVQRMGEPRLAPRHAPAAARFAPEWLVLYALRRHCSLALVGERLLERMPSPTSIAVGIGAVAALARWVAIGGHPAVRAARLQRLRL